MDPDACTTSPAPLPARHPARHLGRPPVPALAGAAGRVLGAGFERLARARGGKPLHPRGVVLDAALRRTGTRRRWGAPWLDEPGEDVGVVRLSRSVGLPGPLPDVLGLAFRFEDATGAHDLLLATTGRSRPGRWLLVPRTDPWGSVYSSLLPYRTPGGFVVLAVGPARRGPDGGHVLPLMAAAPTAAWEPFGELLVPDRPRIRTTGVPSDTSNATTATSATSAGDADIAFDPVAHPLPGLVIPPALAAVREPAYAGARRGRAQPAGGR